MKAYNQTFEKLSKSGFEVIDLPEVFQFGVKSFRNRFLTVILQQWEQTMTAKDIIQETRNIREILLRSNYNAWNTYYLLCSDDDKDIDEDTVFFIERDAAALRKYIIRCESDLSRIPFLDWQESSMVRNPITILERADEYGTTIKALLGYIRQKNGQKVRLKQREVEGALTLITGEQEFLK